MDDKELLERAANVSGMSHPDGWDWITNDLGYKWNPLEDDDDEDPVRVARHVAAAVPQPADGGPGFLD